MLDIRLGTPKVQKEGIKHLISILIKDETGPLNTRKRACYQISKAFVIFRKIDYIGLLDNGHNGYLIKRLHSILISP